MIAHFSAPQGGAIRTAEDLGVELDDEPVAAAPQRVPAGVPDPGPRAARNSAELPAGGQQGRPPTAGILVQFPLSAMAAILTRATGNGGMTLSSHLAEFFSDIGGGGAFAVVIALYTALLGLLVPSDGGKWLVEAPYVMQLATDVQMNLGRTVQIYNIAEALPNLGNPFFMLPLLAVLRLRARDLMGFTFLQFVLHLPVVRLLVWLLGMTFNFVPPVLPAGTAVP
ncbi:TIGR00366 family protein [Arthrobacter sp. UYEF21]|uniref:TIGR00366 family protein n=1 Tax=Arthrobacter sp. UYEF21 TaxID=1756364 RepID=UPI0033945CDD